MSRPPTMAIGTSSGSRLCDPMRSACRTERRGSRSHSIYGASESREPSGQPAGRRSALRGQGSSQLVTLSHPIMPILDRLAGLLIHHDALELCQGNRKGSAAFPADQDEHLVLALRFRGHPDDLDLVADAQRRDAALGDAPGRKREAQLVLEGVVPAHGLLFGRVGIDDDLHGDALLPLLVARSSLHPASSVAHFYPTFTHSAPAF